LFAIYSAVKIVPLTLRNISYRIRCRSRPLRGRESYPKQDCEIIFKEVQDQGLEDRIKREDIKIVANTGIVKIAIDYTVQLIC